MKIIGHRGARGLAPENTKVGIDKALKYGVDLVEVDVRVTADGVPVLLHNKTLPGTDGQKHSVRNSNFVELKSQKSDLLSLDAAIKQYVPTVTFYIEVKRGVNIKPIVKVIQKYSPEKIYLASKSQPTLRALHAKLPDFPVIVIEPISGIRATRRARQLNTKILSMNHYGLWFGFIRAMKKRGYELYTYTLNNPAKAKRFAKHGLDAVITDFPDRYR